MASTKEIKNRINNVNNTRKITNAMYLIASTKVKRAKAELEKTRPYFEMIRSEISRVFNESEEAVESIYFRRKDEEKRGGSVAILCMTADKGLAGAYNQNVIKETAALMKRSEDYRLFIVGDVGRRYFRAHDADPDRVDMDFQSMVSIALEPSLSWARRIAYSMDGHFRSGDFSEIYAVYTDFAGGLSGGTVRSERLLPFKREHFDTPDGEDKGGAGLALELTPSAAAILDGLVRNYLTGYIYSMMVDSYCCEQNARMMAMDAANQNAEDLLAELSLEYNHVRQAAITMEITEISAGAKAKKRNG